MRRLSGSGWRNTVVLAAALLAAAAGLEALAQSGGRAPRDAKKPFTYFESFENADENTPTDPRDLNGNGVIDCGADGDCRTVTSCAESPDLCDEWTLPLAADPDLRFVNEDSSGNKISFKASPGTIFPSGRGTIEVIPAGPLDICPDDLDGLPAGGVILDRQDWHIHTVKTPDIDGMDTSKPGTMPKAFRGQNSLHWGRHLLVPNTRPRNKPVFGDIYCLTCLNAFVLDREGGMTLARSATAEQALRMTFWHIAEFCDDECASGYPPDQSDDVAIVEVRAARAGTDRFGTWERVEAIINPYDGVEDTSYATPTYEPPDDTNPASATAPDITMCFPLPVYVSQGSAKGTDPACGDGDGDRLGDCGNTLTGVLRGAAGVGIWALSGVDLSRYAGRRIQIRFISTTFDGRDIFISYLESDFGPVLPPEASFDDGWYVDDIKVSGLVP